MQSSLRPFLVPYCLGAAGATPSAPLGSLCENRDANRVVSQPKLRSSAFSELTSLTSTQLLRSCYAVCYAVLTHRLAVLRTAKLTLIVPSFNPRLPLLANIYNTPLPILIQTYPKLKAHLAHLNDPYVYQGDRSRSNRLYAFKR